MAVMEQSLRSHGLHAASGGSVGLELHTYRRRETPVSQETGWFSGRIITGHTPDIWEAP